jgi:hypothetical protein
MSCFEELQSVSGRPSDRGTFVKVKALGRKEGEKLGSGLYYHQRSVIKRELYCSW